MEMANTRLERESETVDGIEDEPEEFPTPPRDETTRQRGVEKILRIRQRDTFRKGIIRLHRSYTEIPAKG